jgi:hypothetical protein
MYRIIKKDTEASVQQLIVKYLKLSQPTALYCATAGGLHTSRSQAVRMKMTGYVKGVPDLLIFEPRKGYHGLMLEIKKDSKAKASEYQKEWIEKLKARGYHAAVVHSLDEAIKQIDEYFAG